MNYSIRKIPFVVVMTIFMLGVGWGPALAAGGGHGDGSGADSAAADPNRPHYVKISPIVLPVIGDKGVEQIISLIVALEVKDKATADKIIIVSPRLADAYLQDLYGAIDRKFAVRDGMVDVGRVRAKLEKANTRVLGDGVVQGVLIQAVSQRGVK